MGLESQTSAGGASVRRLVARPDERLAAARRALAVAEQRAGLNGQAAQEVQRAMRTAAPGGRKTGLSLAASNPAGAPASASTSFPLSVRDPWQLVAAQEAGVLSISGSTAVLLAAAAWQQGPHGWCGVLGGQDLGWCAAAELGLDLARVLVVPDSTLEPATVLPAASALLDGVSVLLIGRAAASALRPRSRRLLAVRARERHTLILTAAAWEGARAFSAKPVPPAGGVGQAAATEPSREMAAGYLRHLRWSLSEMRYGQNSSILTLGEQGLSLSSASTPPTRMQIVEEVG